MKLVSHPNVVPLKHCFYSNGPKEGERYLNLVLAYIPDTVYQVCRDYTKAKRGVPEIIIKVEQDLISCTDSYIGGSLVICVSNLSIVSLHTFPWGVSPRHQASKPPV